MSEDDVEVYALDDKDKDSFEYQNLASYVLGRFERAKDRRYSDETRWMSSYRNYRGLYGPDVQFTEAEKSRVFIKITKTKVLAAFGQITDILFSKNRFPIGIEPTEVPEGVAESVHFDPKETQAQAAIPDFEDKYGYAGDEDIADLLGPLEDDLKDIEGLKEGPGLTQSAITFHPAAVAARKAEKKIKDQLEESSATKHLRHAAFECVLFGTAVLKGPFAEEKEYPQWTEDGEYTPTIKTVPKIEYVSVWDFYPDPDALSMDDCSYTLQRHRMTRSQVRRLKKRPYFRDEAIDRAILTGENFSREWYEDDLKDNQEGAGAAGSTGGSIERFEVIEFWGSVDADMIEEYGLEIPEKLIEREELQVNVWICNDEIIRVVINPFTPERIPYCAAPYELNPYSFFGIGLAENMDDTQTLMNGFMRMAVDNAVLSGNLLIEVDETNLVPGQDLTLYPGKVFKRQGGAPGQAIFGTKFPNVSSENMMLFDKARVLADESTGLPSFSHGQTGISGTGRTSSGISMLMGAASGGNRTVIKNIDDYILRPLGEAYYAFNMQFDFDPDMIGDLAVRARGTDSFMKSEVRSQRLISFLQIVSSPMLAPFAKFPEIMREIAVTMDLDPEKITNSPEEAFRQAMLLQQMQAEMGPPPGAPGVPGDPAGGNIGAIPPAGPQQAPQGGGMAPQGGQGGGGGGEQIPPELMAALQQASNNA